jgi:uncharacterized Zn finger protein (UPF0148 family)
MTARIPNCPHDDLPLRYCADCLSDHTRKLEAKAIHCDKCGASWYDDGFTASCPMCRIAELEAEVAMFKAEKTADMDRPQYHICWKHPWLTATSALGAAHFCPACKLEQAEVVIADWKAECERIEKRAEKAEADAERFAKRIDEAEAVIEAVKRLQVASIEVLSNGRSAPFEYIDPDELQAALDR